MACCTSSFTPVEPVPVGAVHVVGKVDPKQRAMGAWVDGHVVRRVVEELGAAVPLDVVAVVVAPAELDVEPVFAGCGGVVDVPDVPEEARQRHLSSI